MPRKYTPVDRSDWPRTCRYCGQPLPQRADGPGIPRIYCGLDEHGMPTSVNAEESPTLCRRAWEAQEFLAQANRKIKFASDSGKRARQKAIFRLGAELNTYYPRKKKG